MAKRKKTSKKKTGVRRRRRVGASGMNDLVMLGVGAVAGAIAGPIVIAKVTPMLGSSIDAKTVKLAGGGLQGVAGYFLAKKSGSPLMKGIGIGLMSSGGRTLASALMPSLGIGAAPVLIPQRGMVAGTYGLQNKIGKTTPNGGYPGANTVSGTYGLQNKIGQLSGVPPVAAAAGSFI